MWCARGDVNMCEIIRHHKNKKFEDSSFHIFKSKMIQIILYFVHRYLINLQLKTILPKLCP